MAAAWLGAAAACFQRVEFRAANLTAAEDGYPYGASHVFYAVHADMFADRRVRHFFYTEPDNAPSRARWADALCSTLTSERPTLRLPSAAGGDGPLYTLGWRLAKLSKP